MIASTAGGLPRNSLGLRSGAFPGRGIPQDSLIVTPSGRAPHQARQRHPAPAGSRSRRMRKPADREGMSTGQGRERTCPLGWVHRPVGQHRLRQHRLPDRQAEGTCGLGLWLPRRIGRSGKRSTASRPTPIAANTRRSARLGLLTGPNGPHAQSRRLHLGCLDGTQRARRTGREHSPHTGHHRCQAHPGSPGQRAPPVRPRSRCAGTRFRWSGACTATLSGAVCAGSNPAGGAVQRHKFEHLDNLGSIDGQSCDLRRRGRDHHVAPDPRPGNEPSGAKRAAQRHSVITAARPLPWQRPLLFLALSQVSAATRRTSLHRRNRRARLPVLDEVADGRIRSGGKPGEDAPARPEGVRTAAQRTAREWRWGRLG